MPSLRRVASVLLVVAAAAWSAGSGPDVVAEVARRVGGGRTMVLLDSDHRMAHVLAELRAYADLVSPGSYLIVQDTNVNGHLVLPGFGPGPMEAVREFLATDDRFEVDRGGVGVGGGEKRQDGKQGPRGPWSAHGLHSTSTAVSRRPGAPRRTRRGFG